MSVSHATCVLSPNPTILPRGAGLGSLAFRISFGAGMGYEFRVGRNYHVRDAVAMEPADGALGVECQPSTHKNDEPQNGPHRDPNNHGGHEFPLDAEFLTRLGCLSQAYSDKFNIKAVSALISLRGIDRNSEAISRILVHSSALVW